MVVRSTALQLDAATFAKLWKALTSAERRSTKVPGYETGPFRLLDTEY